MSFFIIISLIVISLFYHNLPQSTNERKNKNEK